MAKRRGDLLASFRVRIQYGRPGLQNSNTMSPAGYKSTRHTVKSSHGHLVTRLTRHRSTRHIRVSSHSQLVTSEHNAQQSHRMPTDSTQKMLNTDGVITPGKQTRGHARNGVLIENERPEKYQSQLTSATTMTAAAGAVGLCAIIY